MKPTQPQWEYALTLVLQGGTIRPNGPACETMRPLSSGFVWPHPPVALQKQAGVLPGPAGCLTTQHTASLSKQARSGFPLDRLGSPPSCGKALFVPRRPTPPSVALWPAVRRGHRGIKYCAV